MLEARGAVSNAVYEQLIHPINISFYNQMQTEMESSIARDHLTVPQAAIKLYKERNANITVLPSDRETMAILQNGSGVLVGNNPHSGANFVLMHALGDRPTNDYYFFDKAAAKPYWATSIQEHILPTYFDTEHLASAQGFLGTKLKSSPDLPVLKTLSSYDRMVKNNETLSLAVQKIKEGGIVGIFPSGGGDHTKDWRRGIGSITQSLITQEVNSYFIMTFMEGSTPQDKYRLAPFIQHISPIDIKLHISAVPLLEALSSNKPPWLSISEGNQKHISAQLKGYYLNWIYRSILR